MKYYIKGGNRLYGEIKIPAAKNALLPMLAAALLAKGKTTFYNCPKLCDLTVMMDIINGLGAKSCQKGHIIEVCGDNLSGCVVQRDAAERMRSSIFFLSPLLAKLKKAELYFPGGCKIGKRPIDLHINGLRALGVEIIENAEYLSADATNAKCGNCYLRYPSVGATENLIIFATSLLGKSTVYNAAKEPEVKDLCNMLNAMGASIKGVGTSVIEIDGGYPLHSVEYTPIPDRISAGTYLTAAALCGGEVALRGNFGSNLQNYVDKIKNKYCNIQINNDIINIIGNGQVEIDDFVSTGAYPEFATDLQPLIAVAMAATKGDKVLVENVFEDRFRYLDELKKGGCAFQRFGRAVLIHGGKLHGADYVCPDLRAGAALFVASLLAEGQSTLLDDGCYIDRGYDDLCGAFSSLGADVTV